MEKDRKIWVTYFSQGIEFFEKRNYQKALSFFDKAISSHPDKKFPLASFGRGEMLYNLGRHEEAIEAYRKAETDSPEERFPEASCNLGCALCVIGSYKEAIEACSKAETDSPEERLPEASCNRGVALFNLGRYSEAINAFEKAVNDKDGHYLQAHIGLSKVYLKYDFDRAEKHAFIALSQDHNEISVIEHIIQNIAGEKTINLYENRSNYLFLLLRNIAPVKDAFTAKEKIIKSFNTSSVFEKNKIDLFLSLLPVQEIDLADSITFKERLQLSYLLYFIQDKPWNTFHLIDMEIDAEYDLTEMDYYFYFVTSYLIGEPKKEFKYFISLNEIDTSKPFGKKYEELRSEFIDAIQNEKFHDPYLLNIKTSSIELNEKEINLSTFHPWIQHAIECIIDKKEYEVPISDNLLKGLWSQFFREIDKSLESSKYYDRAEWVNLSYSLESKDYKYSVIIKNIRHARSLSDFPNII